MERMNETDPSVSAELKKLTNEDIEKIKSLGLSQAAIFNIIVGLGIPFSSVNIANGGTLPSSTTPKFIFVGQGTFNKPGGGTIVTAKPLNVLSTDGTTWVLNTAIDIPLTPYEDIPGCLSNYLTDYKSVVVQNIKLNIPGNLSTQAILRADNTTTATTSTITTRTIYNYPKPIGSNILRYNVFEANGSINANIIGVRADNTFDVIVAGKNTGRTFAIGEVDISQYDRISMFFTTDQNPNGYFEFRNSSIKGKNLPNIVDEINTSISLSTGQNSINKVGSILLPTDGVQGILLNDNTTTLTGSNPNTRVIHKKNTIEFPSNFLYYKVYKSIDGQANIIGEYEDGTFDVIINGNSSIRGYSEGLLDISKYETVSIYWAVDLNPEGLFTFINVNKNPKYVQNKIDGYDYFLNGLVPFGQSIDFNKEGQNQKLLLNNTTSAPDTSSQRTLYRINTQSQNIKSIFYKVYRIAAGQANIIGEYEDGTFDVIVGTTAIRDYVTGVINVSKYKFVSLSWTTDQNPNSFFVLIKGDSKVTPLKELLKEKGIAESPYNVYRNSNVISQWNTELMAHTAMLYFDKRRTGNIYVPYVYDDFSTYEGVDGGHKCGMLKGNICDLNNFDRIELGGRGSVIGGFTIPVSGDRVSIWEPFLLDVTNTGSMDFYSMMDNVNDSIGARLTHVTFDKVNNVFLEDIQNCKLKYVASGNTIETELSLNNLSSMLVSKSAPITNFGLFIQAINDYVTKDGVNYVVFAGGGGGTYHQGCIYKTEDFITFEFVDQLPVGSSETNYGEFSSVVKDNFLYVIGRRKTTYDIYKYDLTAKTFLNSVIPATIADTSRPKIIIKDGKLLVVYNSLQNKVTTSDGVLQRRSNAVFAELNEIDLSLITVLSTQCKSGVHYFDIKKDINDSWWMVYTSDRRHIALTNHADIQIVSFDKLLKSI